DPQKLKTPADIMPLYLWLMGDDSRRKTGMTFDAQPGRKPGIALTITPSNLPFRFQQAPGAHNSLGRYKFNMPSSDAIYLHDTPNH
ncbi:hypothetical protein ONO57_25710, partial [Salmonella enterica subsp. enterica serovar Anatum]|nr:hypothetical protein [Salmonella enterica subsp. enterica serovar Anatum]